MTTLVVVAPAPLAPVSATASVTTSTGIKRLPITLPFLEAAIAPVLFPRAAPPPVTSADIKNRSGEQTLGLRTDKFRPLLNEAVACGLALKPGLRSRECSVRAIDGEW